MQKMKSLNKRILSFVLAVVIFVGMVPQLFVSLWSAITSLFANAAAVEYIAPECSFKDELYDGSDAIKPLPSYYEYIEQTGYQAPKLLSFRDFRAACGEALLFNMNMARSYMAQGYKIMICDAEELYLYSQVVNGAGSPDEISFYLSANLVLGNNIEYYEMSFNSKFFCPIGNYENPFTGTFDGQSFEIRDLYIDTDYKKATVGFFGVVGENAVIKNFGLFHPTIKTTNPSNSTAAIASVNYGIIDSVYAIVQEYTSADATINIISSANSTYTAGLVAENNSGATLSNSYFAGMLDAHDPQNQHPVCSKNEGTITNCYYDSQVFAWGTTGSMITEVSGEITGLSNIDIKKVGFSENGMKSTKFKVNRINGYALTSTDTRQTSWGYPRLYGFTGTGTKDDPFLISTPADLIYFPCSYEYSNDNKYKYFALANCIDMNEVAPNSYRPKLDASFYSNSINNTGVAQFQSNINNRNFYGYLSGTAHNGEENCGIHHVTGLGNDYKGDTLQECHMILNLTIDTPATTVNDKNKSYTALIASNLFANTNLHTTVKDLHFVGGTITSGDSDAMPTSYNSSAWNSRTATVIANVNYADMDNVHSSATVKMGTGKQYSVLVGGLTADGVIHNVRDCTNSGNIIGGYIEMPGEVYLSENYHVGGLLGSVSVNTNDRRSRYVGRLVHVANYGNVFGAVVITDEENDWKLTGGSSILAGISTDNLSAQWLGNVTERPADSELTYINDDNRMDRVANFGNLFDGPIALDEKENPIFDENGKPQALPLEDGKKVVGNQSPLYFTYMYGIGYNYICNAYNGGNLYSVTIEKSSVSGIGYMAYNGTVKEEQYLNYLNYNKGNIYMYVGGLEAHGIADQHAYKCLNSGDILLLGGNITTNSHINTIGNVGGFFSGISGNRAKGCYNDGNIYLAPKARRTYNTENSDNKVVLVSGLSSYTTYLDETEDDGSQTRISSINRGKLTVDLEKNDFNPESYTTALNNESHMTLFRMMGTGVGGYNENYGEFSFVPFTKQYQSKVRLSIAGCGGTGADWYSGIINCRNYSDISVDMTNTPYCLQSLTIRGIGYNSYNPSISTQNYKFYDNINFGDITFSGKISNALTIYTLGGDSGNTQNNINLGNVTITKDSQIPSLTIGMYYNSNNNRVGIVSGMMNGWYDGCTIPESLNTEENQKIFEKLDKNKRYGKITVSGSCNSVNIFTTGFYQNNSYLKASKIVNNGEITVTDIISKGIAVYGISYHNVEESQNHAPITLKNAYLNGNVHLVGAAAGKRNINYADITAENCVTRVTGNANIVLAVYGVARDSSTAENLENRGKLTVKNVHTATVNGTEYLSTSRKSERNVYDATVYVAGIGNVNAKSCVNFGDIYVEDVIRHRLGGISTVPSSSNSNVRCINYGNITSKNSGGEIYIGGISYQVTGEQSLVDCANFGEINIINPTSHYNSGMCVGGVCGYANGSKTGGVYSCTNYGKINYINEKGANTANEYTNTRKGQTLNIGGVVGYDDNTNNLRYVMNYGDIKVTGEENQNIFAGGITGQVRFNNAAANGGYGMINYGDLLVPSANLTQGNASRIGGLVGYMNVSQGQGYSYGINYGIPQATNGKNEKTSIASLLGYFDGYCMNYCVDLSSPPEGEAAYPLCDGYPNNSKVNAAEAVNYTWSEEALSATSAQFGTVELVTLDNTENGGLFAPDFVFRSKLIQTITGNYNQENGFAYQNFELLSPYLQSYMLERFGEEIKNYGAYVMLDKGANFYRSVDEYFPYKLVPKDIETENKTEEETEKERISQYLGCYYENYESSGLIKDIELDELYSSMISPENRTIKTDLEIYACQVQKSPLPEIYEMGMTTKYQYANTETSFYQHFEEYQDLIETHPAKHEDGTLSDNVIYTDINIYVAIDDINTYRAKTYKTDENGNYVLDDEGEYVLEDIEPNGYLYLYPDIDIISNNSSMRFYQGDTMEVTERIRELTNYYDHYPEPWLTCDNLSEKLEDESLWSKEFYSYGDYLGGLTNFGLMDVWEIAIPFKSLDDTENIYTKVLGVITSEDGLHKNIVVAHVIIDRYDPHAELSQVTLQTPSDGTVISSVENSKISYTEGNPSLTDSVDDAPVNDVIYYFMEDTDLTGQNIQKYNWSSSSSYPLIELNTYNMDEEGRLKAVITRHEQTPGDGLYNDMVWNDYIDTHEETKDSIEAVSIELNPFDVVYDEEQKSTGKAKFTIPSSTYKSIMFYGGLYRIDLYCERTKNSNTFKHFATIFVAKQYSPHNTINNPDWWHYLVKRNPYFYYSGNTTNQHTQTEYDSTHPKVDGYQTGYVAFQRPTYNYQNLSFYYYTRSANDSNTWNGHGIRYGLKGYLSPYSNTSYYLGRDNAEYNYILDEESSTAIRGEQKKLENQIKSIYIYQNSETGAYYPMRYEGVLDIMAENGDIRRYTSEYVQNGVYGENDESTYNNNPVVKLSWANKNGYPIIAEEDGTYKGIIYGTETEDVTFRTAWTSSNVTLYHSENSRRPNATNEIYAGDGYNADKIRVFFKATNSSTSVELTQEQIDEYFTLISVDVNGNWTFTFKNTAPTGEYQIVPYMTYHMDFSKCTEAIKVYDGSTEDLLETSDTNIFEWSIPYSMPFVIENRPNDDSYITELDVTKDQSTPFIMENSEIEGQENRDVYIREASENQEVVYEGYEDVRTGDIRADKFTVYSYVGKTEQESDITMRVPYRATLQKWTGSGSPFDETPVGSWQDVTPVTETDEEGNPVESDYKQYKDHVTYNELKLDGDYSYNPSATYYKITAEDGTTSTVYTVNVIPGVRNKSTTLEIAQSSETPTFGGSEAFKEELTKQFEESDKLYREILENYGQVSATIKELSGTRVDFYQTKMFDSVSTDEETQPYVYNLKSFVYDISIDLPAGYTYDVILLSEDKDGAQVLSDSHNGFDGKQLIFSSSDDQNLNIRIVLKRDMSKSIWGVQYIWDFSNASCDENGHVNIVGGGYFNNYVYNVTTTS